MMSDTDSDPPRFPVGEDEVWTRPPWSGALSDGCAWGRGAYPQMSANANRIAGRLIADLDTLR